MPLLKGLLAFVLFGCIQGPVFVQAQDADPAPSSVPATSSTTIPSASNYSAHLDWNQQCAARVQSALGKPVDILFIGNSITQNWTDPDWGGEYRGRLVWAENYAPRNALNFGVGADKTQNILWRMNTMNIRGIHPRVVVVMAGANNTTDTPQAIADGVHAILDKTQQFYPGVRIILVSILPNLRANRTAMETNAILQHFADNKSVEYLDLVPLFHPKGDNWIGIGRDHLHPNEVGYRIWADAMNPLLTKLLPGCRPVFQQSCTAE